MVPFTPLHAPARRFDVARIDRVAEHIADALVRYPPILRLGVERMLFEEAHDVRLRFKLARHVSLERLLDDRRVRLLGHEHTAIEAWYAPIGVAGRRGEHGKAV
ncbi:hypothetical protein D8770_21830 [Methylobacterium sp. DB1607]|nr:hypothetical protein [Methylobacterium sp. DB1607]